MLTRDRSRAVIFGLACGDALGWPTEFKKMPEIWARYGPTGIRDLCQTKGEFTDDTQMTVALARGLLDAFEETRDNSFINMADPNYVMPFVAKRFVDWALSPENNRAPGSSCMGGCRGLAAGGHWTRTGVRGSPGCGALMRVAPVGLLYRNKTALRAVAEAQATCTHDSDTGRESAYLGALAIKLLVTGEITHVTNLVHELRSEAQTERQRELLTRVPVAVSQTMIGAMQPHEVMDFGDRPRLGQSWKGDEALASALYCLLLADTRGGRFVETVRLGANTPGDSDSIASIAGGMAGALWGLETIPPAWIDRIEDTDRLAALADRLAESQSAIGGR